MPGIKDLKKVANASADTIALQSRLNEFLQPLTTCPILNGHLLLGVALAAGANDVEHKLGRELIGWMLVRNRANSVLWDSQDTNKFAKKTLILNASASTNIDLWVF